MSQPQENITLETIADAWAAVILDIAAKLEALEKAKEDAEQSEQAA